MSTRFLIILHRKLFDQYCTFIFLYFTILCNVEKRDVLNKLWLIVPLWLLSYKQQSLAYSSMCYQFLESCLVWDRLFYLFQWTSLKLHVHCMMFLNVCFISIQTESEWNFIWFGFNSVWSQNQHGFKGKYIFSKMCFEMDRPICECIGFKSFAKIPFTWIRMCTRIFKKINFWWWQLKLLPGFTIILRTFSMPLLITTQCMSKCTQY